MIDASFLDEVTFKHPYKLLITPNYSFEAKHEFYIKFEQGVVESFEGCQSTGNEPILDKDVWNIRCDTSCHTRPIYNAALNY